MTDSIPVDLSRATLAESGGELVAADSEDCMPWAKLSTAAGRYRQLELDITPVDPGVCGTRDGLRRRAHVLDRALADLQTEQTDGGLPGEIDGLAPLWNVEELGRFRAEGPRRLESEWFRRVSEREPWASVGPLLRPDVDFGALWSLLPGGDFDEDGRGTDYTEGLRSFQGVRCIGTQILLQLLQPRRPKSSPPVFLDVLGGDGYVWRLARASRRADCLPASLIVTNDLSGHMFGEAGLWGLPTREDATCLARTFEQDAFDGVLLAYGTHHIERLDLAVGQVAEILVPGGAVVVHDFLDEGAVGTWFHEVVHPYSKTGHDLAHISPIRMAVLLYLAGFHAVELHEIEDPFVFVVPAEGGTTAREVALDHLLGMYGLHEKLGQSLDLFESLIVDTLTYPEIGNLPYFESEFVYIPRRAVVARAEKPLEAAAEYSFRDLVLIRRLRDLLAAPSRFVDAFDLPLEVRRHWLGDEGELWGLDPTRSAEFVSWADREIAASRNL